MNAKRNGFSLVEILVAMAIIAALIAIAVYGISVIQRNSRNTKRRKINDNIELAINDIEADTQESPTWMSYDQSTKSITLSLSQASPVLNRIPVLGFTTIEALTSENCWGGNDNFGFGRDETNSDRLWVCFNPTNLTHGVRLEKKGKGEIIEQVTATDANKKSSRVGRIDGTDWRVHKDSSMNTYWGRTWLEYQVTLDDPGDYSIEVEAKNSGTLPADYNNFKVEIFVDNTSEGIVYIPADSKNYQTASLSISDLDEGKHDIKIVWLNDQCDSCRGGTGDANIQIKNMTILK
ncbi:prepilin-type N-terminal cleavage/methylation domain-containing protein [Candidatus Dojkabacteria bacterium]|nr:prepilin-type N-terminal cleavage/methylation domain-containing protein [Candidatus Dojkabacteria bacterium]